MWSGPAFPQRAIRLRCSPPERWSVGDDLDHRALRRSPNLDIVCVRDRESEEAVRGVCCGEHLEAAASGLGTRLKGSSGLTDRYLWQCHPVRRARMLPNAYNHLSCVVR